VRKRGIRFADALESFRFIPGHTPDASGSIGAAVPRVPKTAKDLEEERLDQLAWNAEILANRRRRRPRFADKLRAAQATPWPGGAGGGRWPVRQRTRRPQRWS
jgi:hypothetical protein